MKLNLILSQGRAADRTALTIKGAALTARALTDRFDVAAISVGEPSPPAEDNWDESLQQARPTLLAVHDAIENSIQSGGFTLLVSNTCSISLASLPVMARNFSDAVLVWIDAHGDFNTPQTSTSGYLGGMVVAAACGLWSSGHGAGLDASRVIFVGARDLDSAEEALIRGSGAQIIPPAEVTADAVLKAIDGRRVWIHIDWDVLEPGHVPADYKVTGGLLPTQIRAVFEALPPDEVLGLELAEYQVPANPQMSQAALATIMETVSPLLGRVYAS